MTAPVLHRKPSRVEMLAAVSARLCCPACGNRSNYQGHQSGNGCKWCDHVGTCEPCTELEKAKKRP